MSEVSGVDPRVEAGARALIANFSFFDPSDNADAWRAARFVLAAADAVSGGEDRLTADTLICCDHAMVATAQCEHGGDGLASLGELIAAYSSPVSGVGEDREPVCAVCGHEWRRHDPEDGRCDAHSSDPEHPYGPCRCGRDLAWMQHRIAALGRDALSARSVSDKDREPER